MPAQEPSVEEVEESIKELLRDEPVATLATLDSDGNPATSHMHYGADGLRVYMLTFGYTRKHAEILANPRVSYSVHHAPPGGFAERLQSRSLQVKGRACVVHDAEEIAHAVKVIREQLQEPGPDSMFDNVKPPEQGGQQVMLRVDPVEALWADTRVRLLWRMLLEFSEGGKRVTGMRSYDSVIERKKGR
ncbi:pyridoxamine 5'-phosphate oxidase family protein [Streptomyces shenzhenensis]|uniref:pyridoxamine 5'-phosphate oxidase family protein n=1 Tax=Streptomyces shenzhenensis TaxID=943815 RepID=UPI001604DBCB|nr:pyridoxamine 5'-phosphate oxidase family protein [Streptomyces shenzhenensis]